MPDVNGGIPLLGQNSSGRDNSTPPAQVIDADCAMLLYRTADGVVVESDDIDLLIHVKRKPSLDDMHGMAAVALKDFQATETVQTLMVRTAQMGQAMQQQAINDAIKSQVTGADRATAEAVARRVRGG
jgi:hypothetical protein